MCQVKLHLKDHCIETEAKRELRRLMNIFFESDNPPADLIESIDILEKFLTRSDFPSLRSSDIRLSGDIESIVCITTDEEDNIRVSFENG
jgi:hypothetical protein